MKIYSFILTLVVAPSFATVQEQSNQPLTVEQAVNQAIQNNPRMQAVAQDLAAARAGVRSAGARANPSVTFTPAITSGGSDEEVLVQQSLEINGTRTARSQVARAQLTETQANGIVELRSLVFETKAAYYELARARHQEELARNLVQFFQELDQGTRRQVEIGTRPGIDQITTGIELTRAQQQLTLAEAEEERAVSTLNAVLGRNPREPIGALSTPETKATALDEDVLLELALNARAEITADSARAEALRREADLVRAEGRPDLVPQYRAAGLTQGERSSGFGVGISFPFLDYGARRSRISQLDRAAKAQDARVEAKRIEVRRDVSRALALLRAADAVVARFESGILEQANQLLEASRRGFQAGQTTIVALLEAQRTYRSVLSDYNAAVLAQATARAELERATGAVPATMLPVLKENSR